MNNREMRRRTVIAMMALPSLGVPHDRVEPAADEVADAPALLTTFTSFAMKELAQKDPQRARMIEQTWQWLRDNLHGMSAGALLSGAADKLGLFTEISRRYLNHEKSVSARLSLKGFIDFATESGLDALTFLDHMEQLSIAYNKNSGASVRVSTCHSAKGYEWSHVIMPELKQGLFPLKGQPIPEERRVFYVGITRARNRLTLLAPEDNVPGNWQNVDAPHKMHTSGTSTFLFDIEPQNTKKKM
jgi:DNA helicase-2/ATP-dependent DNA helicase PcrA